MKCPGILSAKDTFTLRIRDTSPLPSEPYLVLRNLYCRYSVVLRLGSLPPLSSII